MFKWLIGLALLLIVLHSQTISLRTASLAPSKIPIRKIKPLQTADAYFGSVDIDIQDGDSEHLEYYVYFVQNNNSCSSQKCYNGWVANYTASNQTVQGYPDGTDPKPVFSYFVNSSKEFLIVRDPSLSSQFVDIIQISCHQFDPTIASPAPTPNPSSTFSAASSSNLKLSSQALASAFIAPPRLLIAPSSNPGPSAEFNFVAKEGAPGFQVASNEQDLSIKNLQAEVATLSRQVEIDSNSQVTKRTEYVDLKLTSNYLQKSSETSDLSYNFVGKIGVRFERKSPLSLDVTVLQAQIAKISKKSANSFNSNAIEARRANVDQSKFRSLDFQPKDILTEQPSVVTLPDEPGEFNLEYQVKKAADKAAKDALTPQKIAEKVKQTNILLDNIAKLTFPSGTIIPTSNLDLLTPQTNSIQLSNPSRLLPSTQIFTYTKILYQKTILGSTFSVTVQVEGYQLDLFTVQLIGTMVYNIFGNIKTTPIFDFTKKAGFSWSLEKSFSGTWNFQKYIPLPPPVSFMGINFQISLTYYIQVKLFANGAWSTQINGYAFQAGAVATTGLNTDTSAALRVVAVEGGVYIAGTLVSLSTDPTLHLNFLISQNKLEIILSWYFYINAFNMDWGFFWRYRKWNFKWSDKIIIIHWPINGIHAQYTVYELHIFKKLW